MPRPRLSLIALGWIRPGSRPQPRPRAIAPLFTASAGAPGALWPPMATCDLLRSASRRGPPPAFGQRGPAKRRAEKDCAQHKRAREHRARARGGLGCGRVRTVKQEVDRMSMSKVERAVLKDCIMKFIVARAFSTRECSGTCQGEGLGSGRELELSPRHAQTSHKVRGSAIDSSCHLHHAQGCKHTQSAPQEYPAAR